VDAGTLCTGHLDNPDAERWQRVPPAEHSTQERVLSAMASWTPPVGVSAPEQIQDIDSYPYAALRALLPPQEADRIFTEHGDWPNSLEALVLIVARWLDRPVPEPAGAGRG
jgi:hypothetical protein